VAVDRNHNVVFENRIDWPFWEGLHAGEVRLQRCSGCSRWMWPAEYRCGECGSWELHWEPVAGEGAIYAWERTHYPFVKAFADMMPYVNVLVEFPHAGNRRLVGLLLPPNEGVKIGAKVVADIRPPSPKTYDLPALWWRLADTV
jgi:uncharacterized OB-fold protein